MSNFVQSRKIEYDLLKALGIFLMVAQHQWWGGYIATYIMSFHMPLFFIVSGICYRQHTVKEVFSSRIHKLIIPYVFWGVVYITVNQLFPEMRLTDNGFLENAMIIIGYPTKSYIPINPSLWFLYCMFLVDVIFAGINEFRLSQEKKTLLCLFVGVAGLLIIDCLNVILPFAISSVFAGLCFKTIGFLLNRNKLFQENIKYWMACALLICGAVTAFINRDGSWVDMRLARYNNIALYIISASATTIGWLILITKIVKYMKKFSWQRLSFVGANSMVYVCLNEFLLKLSNILLGFNIQGTYRWLFKAIQLLMVMIICVFVGEKIKNMRIKWIFGY